MEQKSSEAGETSKSLLQATLNYWTILNILRSKSDITELVAGLHAMVKQIKTQKEGLDLWATKMCQNEKTVNVIDCRYIINRPGVAGAVLQTPSSLIHSLSQNSFSYRYSKHHKSQALRGRELKF